MSPEVVVRVRFVQSGGVVGAVRACELDTARLSPEAVRELEALVQSSGLVASGEFLSPGGRDLRLYEIHVERDAGPLSMTFDDQTLPVQARPLVSFLRRNATPRPPE
jgi:hypothetical protein